MSESKRLLELIDNGVVAHGGDLGGWTRISDDTLQLFDGRVTLRAELFDAGSAGVGTVHAHILTTLHEYHDEVLDACLFGIKDTREASLAEAAMIWLTSVAGPIKSFLDDKPLCMSCRAGVDDGDPLQGYSREDYGIPGLRAYVGPAFARGLDAEQVQSAGDDTNPWFRFAAESAAPRRVHLAKASIMSKGEIGWSRDLEIDGHEVSYHDPEWPATVCGPDFGYMTRFAVFEFPPNSLEMSRRAKIDQTIRYFAENFSKQDSVDQLIEAMIQEGFDRDLVHETESISTIAISRALFEPLGVQFSPTIIRARSDGRVETDVPLMSIPAYSRARALAAEFRETMTREDFQNLCSYSAEANAILKAIEAEDDKIDLTQLKMYPCIVPDRETTSQTMDIALAKLNELTDRNRSPLKSPWWKFW